MKKIKTFIKNLLKKNEVANKPDAIPSFPSLDNSDVNRDLDLLLNIININRDLDLLLNIIKVKLEMEYDKIFENELSNWNKPSKELKQAMLGIIGKSWLTNTDAIRTSKVNK